MEDQELEDDLCFHVLDELADSQLVVVVVA